MIFVSWCSSCVCVWVCVCSVGAKMMVYLDPSSESTAAELATSLDKSLTSRTIKVALIQHDYLLWHSEESEIHTTRWYFYIWRTIECACVCVSDVHRGVAGLKGWQLGSRTAEGSGVLPRFLPQPVPLLPGLHAPRLPGQRCRHHQRRPVIRRPRGRDQRDMKRFFGRGKKKVCVWVWYAWDVTLL